MSSYRSYFFYAVQENYPDNADQILNEIEANYRIVSKDTAFALTSPNPIDKRLDFCSFFLALIITLDKRHKSYEEIRKICLEIVTNYVQPKSTMHGYVKKLLPRLIHTWLGRWVVESLKRRTATNPNPEGFIANIITDKNETLGFGYGVDILECGICKLFHKHRSDHFSAILCEVDEITSGLAGLKLIRTGTIANGASKCDFRFKREN